MKIRILGGHNVETNNTGCNSILIDEVLAVDAGALTAKLSLKEQKNLKAVLISHQHYDHIKDIPLLGMNFYMQKQTLEIYTFRHVHKTLEAQLFNDILYPDFSKQPPEKPALHINIVEPGRTYNIAGYNVLPVKVNHSVPTVGYQITSPHGKKVFITSDTGPGLEECWEKISPNLLLIETTCPNKDEDFAIQSGHLTPALLQKELESFLKIKAYLPQVILVHVNPIFEKEIKAEVREVEKSLDAKIRIGSEGMQLNI
ncbi:MAG: lactamase [Dehalococcoidales bacterium]|nr:lactamase [Dehalococcoidales bacterium]